MEAKDTIETEYETYSAAPDAHGGGYFFFTDCGNTMFNINNDPKIYHGKLCPKCFLKGKYTILYMRGSEEAKSLLNKKV